MLKQEIGYIHSKNRDGSLRYPGPHRFIWARVASVWMLVGVERA